MTDPRPATSAALPPPRTPGRYRVALVCLGNICRSPMAHVVLADELERAGLADRVEVVSAGTAGWHVGKPMDRRAAATLTASGYDASRHRARQFEPEWHRDHDLVLAMDASNRADLAELLDPDPGRDGGVGDGPRRLLLFRDLDPLAADGDRDVPDPYYGDDDGFAHVLGLVRRTSRALACRLGELLADGPGHEDRRAAE